VAVRIETNKQSIRPLRRKCCEGRIDLADAAASRSTLGLLVPTATCVAVLVNPANAENPESEIEAAARTIGLQI
jgi:hypothetical protein